MRFDTIGSAFISDEQACYQVAALEKKGQATLQRLNQCISNASQNRQEGQRALAVIGAGVVGAGLLLWLLLRSK